jgi:hypothetical protein
MQARILGPRRSHQEPPAAHAPGGKVRAALIASAAGVAAHAQLAYTEVSIVAPIFVGVTAVV